MRAGLLFMLLASCGESLPDAGSGPRAAQLNPVCVVWCTSVFERAVGGDLGDLSLSTATTRKGPIR